MNPASAKDAGAFRRGLAYGVTAYGLWGLFPIYLKQLRHVPAAEVMAQRVCWSLVLLAGLVTLGQSWGQVAAALRNPRARRLLAVSTLLIGINWFVYLHAVATERIVHASLGYFITPLVSVLLGMMVLGERPRRLQGLALLLAGAGAAVLVAVAGMMPWIAAVLACTFGCYGLMRKLAPVEALAGLTIETALLTPLALAYLVWLAVAGESSFGTVDAATTWLLIGSGAATAVPLCCFGAAARRLPLTTLGPLQYLSPSLAFLLGVWVYHEPFSPGQFAGFALIWLALLVFTYDLFSR